MESFELTPAAPLLKKVRVIRDPTPRFKSDIHTQSDVVFGHLESQIDAQHLVRGIWEICQQFDVSSLESRYSVLGRHGYPPRRLLALWLYASLVGEHEASKVCTRCQTDAAFRWICGGRTPSSATLKRFRSTGQEVFEAALSTTIKLAFELGLIDPTDLAVDSVRVRAHASTESVRTIKRSKQRLEELGAQSLEDADETLREKHAAKVLKHKEAIERCTQAGRTNVVLTNELAGLLKFPNGASAPGHRVTVTAAGVKERLVLSLLIDADSSDYGKLVASVTKARDALLAAGLDENQRLVAAADAGYFSKDDLEAALAQKQWLDVIVADAEKDGRGRKKYFGRDRFKVVGDEAPVCPAGTVMGSLYVRDDGTHEWSGVGCKTCPLRSECTSGSVRRLSLHPALEQMRRTLADPLVKARYNRRIATVEPVFAHLTDTMRYRRVTTRNATTIRAEVLLKVVAHNVGRLLVARRLRRVWVPEILF